ncbi:hypothetical protein AYK26_01630 [Euryarchaeota archaeon SM23-78]|nr:MAG: hypothetical protein AYK26_01630 [Euryarchaeota archaeon SM23-78]MBW3000479.1 hypothetical protein [Candidatus Woesearchaeota archaeon]
MIINEMGSALTNEAFFHEFITQPLVKKIRAEFDKKPKKELKKIIEEYEAISRYKKFMRLIRFYHYKYYETNLRYHIAKAYLDGTIEKVKEQERKKKQEKEKRRLEERIRNEMIEKGKKVEFFPSNLEEYERFKVQKYDFIDTGKQDKEMTYFKHDKILFQFGKLGVEALIRCSKPSFEAGYYKRRGLPVKRAKQESEKQQSL